MNVDKLLNIAIREHKEDDEITVVRLVDLLTRFSKEGRYEIGISEAPIIYIIASNEVLYDNLHNIYDIVRNEIKIDEFENTPFSSSEKALVRLGYNLFNGYRGGSNENEIKMYSVSDIMDRFDGRNMRVAFNAIKIRYGEFAGIEQ